MSAQPYKHAFMSSGPDRYEQSGYDTTLFISFLLSMLRDFVVWAVCGTPDPAIFRRVCVWAANLECLLGQTCADPRCTLLSHS